MLKMHKNVTKVDQISGAEGMVFLSILACLFEIGSHGPL